MDARTWDRLYPYILGACGALVYLLLFRQLTVPKTSAELLSAVVSLAGILVGFLIAAQSILLSFDDARIIQQLRAVGRYDSVLDRIDSAMWWSFGLAVLSGVCLLADFDNTRGWGALSVLVIAVWVFSSITTACLCHGVMRVFKKIIRAPNM